MANVATIDEVMAIEPATEMAASTDYSRNCVICLEKDINDLTLLSCCTHYFCYHCIVQWTFTNPCCPMCKKSLEFIKHKLKPEPTSLPAKFDDYAGETENIPNKVAEFELRQIRLTLDRQRWNTEEKYIDDCVKILYQRIERIKHFVDCDDYSVAEGEERKTDLAERISSYNRLKQMVMAAGTKDRVQIFSNPEFRRIVYKYNLGPRCRVAPRFPFDTSVANVTANQELVRSKIIPYLVMDLCGQLRNNVIDVDRYLNVVMNYLKEKDKQKKISFTKRLEELKIVNPNHFLSNLVHFLSSGQRLDVYHENSEYWPRNEVGFRNLSNDNNEVEIIGERNQPTQALPQVRPTQRFVDATEVINNIRARQQTVPDLTPEDRWFQRITQGDQNVILLSDDDDVDADDDDDDDDDDDADDDDDDDDDDEDSSDNNEEPPLTGPTFAHPACRLGSSVSGTRISAAAEARLMRDMPANLAARVSSHSRGNQIMGRIPTIGMGTRPLPSLRPFRNQEPTNEVIVVDDDDDTPGPSTTAPRRPPPSESDSDVEYLGSAIKRARIP